MEDKFLGSPLAFTPDSKRLVYSLLHRSQNYYQWTDLRVHDLDSGKTYWLTDEARARDPDISRDGSAITYTVAADSGTDLVVAKLELKDGRLVAANPRKIVDAAPYDRVSNPRFTPDGKGVVYANKVEGEGAESLRHVAIADGAISTLVADGSRNRFPAFDGRGTLHFVSDRSGVDNLYRHETGKDTMVTNVTGALWLPTFRGQEAYASVLSKDGFSIGKVELFPAGIDPAKVAIKPGEDAPTSAANARAVNVNQSSSTPPPAARTTRDYPVEDYSTLPTLLPRQWAPIFYGDKDTTYAGVEAAGYDNTFRHQYFLLGAYESLSKNFDYLVQYENRQLGPSVQFFGAGTTKDVQVDATANGGTPASYTRDTDLGVAISFPFQQMTSVFTPIVAASLERSEYFELPGGTKRLLYRTRHVPRYDLLLDYTAVRTSQYAVAAERGSTTQAGVRQYDLGARDVYKGIFRHTQYFHLGRHTVLFPTLRAMKVSRRDPLYFDASAINRGKRDRIIEPLYSDSFDEFGIRGYPDTTFSTREAVTLSTDLRFPLSQIFRGWGTNPIFLNQLAMQIFAEDTYRPSAAPRFQHLPSAGAGLRLGFDALLILPLTLGVDYHYGFNKDAFGQGEVFVSLTASSLFPF